MQIPVQLVAPPQPPVPPTAPPPVSSLSSPDNKPNNTVPPLSKIENKFDHLNASIDALIQEQKKSNQNLEGAIRNLCSAYYKEN